MLILILSQVKPPVPSKPSLTTASCDAPPADEGYREIRAPPIPPRPASSQPVRSDPDQHLYEDISVLLDQRKTVFTHTRRASKHFSCTLYNSALSSSTENTQITSSLDVEECLKFIVLQVGIMCLMRSSRRSMISAGKLQTSVGSAVESDPLQCASAFSARRFAQTVQRVRSGVQLYQQVLFLRGTGMMNFITQLNCIADELDKTVKKTRIAGITGGTTGAIGTAAILAGIALAPMTLGASLAVAGIGVGVAAAGGVTGASAAISKKVRKTQDRRKVEKILRNYQSQMEDVEECLKFIISGMEHLRRPELASLASLAVDADARDVLMLAERLGNSDVLDALSENSRVVQAFAADLDSYFTKDDAQRLKRGSESVFAAKIREVALKLKENIDQLIRIKNIADLSHTSADRQKHSCER
uniref:Uncharacterized protein n=1 Tax=Sinocyclocheilus grahami TaxID=75366 RepID=A0A672K5A0_SINGR